MIIEIIKDKCMEYGENGGKNSLVGSIKSEINIVKHDILNPVQCSYLNDCICILNEGTMAGLTFESK